MGEPVASEDIAPEPLAPEPVAPAWRPTIGMPEEDPSPDAGIAGDGLGDEVYMIAFGTFVAAVVVGWVGMAWAMPWVVALGIGFFLWRVITVWPPARSAWLRFSIRAASTWGLLWRFAVLSMKRKTPEVSSEMGHAQVHLLATAPFLSPMKIFMGVVALVTIWGGWGWFIHAPAIERKLKEAEAASAVAVGANSDWETQIRAYKASLAEANARIEAQSREAQAGESAAFQRGRMEERRRQAGREKQRRLTHAAQNPGTAPTDIDSFLRDIGLAPAGDQPAGGSPAPDGGGAEPPPSG